jgi:hypothetical protein
LQRLAITVVLIVAFAAGAAWFAVDRGFPGRGGDAVAEDRPLPPFSSIEIEGFADVTLVQGRSESIRVETPARQLPRVQAEVRDGTLHITGVGNRSWWGMVFGGGARTVRITVTSREIESVRAGGTVRLRADGLKTDTLAIDVAGAAAVRIAGLVARALSVSGSGAVKLDIAGRVNEQKIVISGAGAYRAAALASDDASVNVSGAGKVFINAAKTLQISISGAGSVEYIGDPQVTKEISGVGRVRKREAAAAVRGESARPGPVAAMA